MTKQKVQGTGQGGRVGRAGWGGGGMRVERRVGGVQGCAPRGLPHRADAKAGAGREVQGGEAPTLPQLRAA